MKFSVYDYRTGKFRYYEHGALGNPVTTGFFRPQAGSHPDSLAAPLPAGAVYLGEGALPEGQIATDNKQALVKASPFTLKKAIYATSMLVSAYTLWKKVREWQRRSK